MENVRRKSIHTGRESTARQKLQAPDSTIKHRMTCTDVPVPCTDVPVTCLGTWLPQSIPFTAHSGLIPAPVTFSGATHRRPRSTPIHSTPLRA